jgi:hypothetical protein
MGLLRIILLLGNAALLAWLAYHWNSDGPPRADEALVVYGLGSFLVLNFIYLLLGNRLAKGRIARLINLWFDAKETELRKRKGG